MKCEHFEELFSLYADNMTGEKENETIAKHLDNCPKCQIEYGAFLAMRQKLRELPIPAVPDRFIPDLMNRLSREQSPLIDFRKERTSSSRKSGWASWMAASAAGIALAIGVYMSSYLPNGSQMVAHFDQTEPSSITAEQIIDKMGIAPIPDEKPPININPFTTDNIIEDYAPDNSNYSVADYDDSDENSAMQTADNSSSNNNAAVPPADSANPENATDSSSISTVASADNYIAQHIYSSNTVKNIDEAIKKVESVAVKQGLEYDVVGSQDSSTMTVASAQENQSIILQVPPEQVDQVLQNLAAYGIVNPVTNEIDYTSEYNDVNKQLGSVQESIDSLEKQPKLDKEQKLVLEKLQKDQAVLEEQKNLIESETGTVKLEVNFNTVINP